MLELVKNLASVERVGAVAWVAIAPVSFGAHHGLALVRRY